MPDLIHAALSSPSPAYSAYLPMVAANRRPIWPTESPTPTPTPTSLPYEESPFGFHPASVDKPDYPDNGFVDAQYIGIRWHRPPLYAYWFLIQPNLNDPTYDWVSLDRQYGSVPSGIHILGNIAPENPHHPQGYMLSGSYLPVDEAKYAAFVRATVERYDGDG
jgi:hypothetical protein